jgi:hypothetical protein
MGLIEAEKLRYEDNRDMQNGHRDTPGSPVVQGLDTGGSHAQNGSHPSKQERSEPIREVKPPNTRLGRMKNGGAS